MPPISPQSPRTRYLTVSELTAKIKQILEDAFPFVWVTGEVSNIRTPASGHYYFTLKDDAAQINAVMFRGQSRMLKFALEDGLDVSALGRISVYEPRGVYQLIVEYLEPKGVGALQMAFEQLKRRLADQGYFDERHKKPLPFLPGRIAVVTSPSGAVLHDILDVVQRRFPGIAVDVVPVRVQGAGAEDDIADALRLIDRHGKADAAILARGGGSLEDLQAFNSEKVAMAVFEADVPVISAIGHETDVTIADFVADLRAPTPSAAAELVVPLKSELNIKVSQYQIFLIELINRYIQNLTDRVRELGARLIDPQRRLDDLRLNLDDLGERLEKGVRVAWRAARQLHQWKYDNLMHNIPINYILKSKQVVEYHSRSLTRAFQGRLQMLAHHHRELTAQLAALDPEAVLSRGYSITRSLPHHTILKDAGTVSPSQAVEVTLARGRLSCAVKEVHRND